MSLLKNMIVRNDSEGQGHFGAKRGNRLHYGVDWLVEKGEAIFSPTDGKLVRMAYPDANDYSKSGFLFKEDATGIEHKVFYAIPDYSLIGKNVKAGQKIATAQSVSEKYGLSKMKDHIHHEMTLNGNQLNPEEELKKKVNTITNLLLLISGISLIIWFLKQQ